MPDPEERQIIEFDQLNPVGKAVFIAGAVAHTTATAIDKMLEKAVDLVLEAERAFKEGMDSTVEDAKVLEEHEDVREKGKGRTGEREKGG